MGPTLICIGLYLTLKHAVTALLPSLSRVPPRVYPWFFVPADVSCLVIQAIGGGLAAAGGGNGRNLKLLDHGNRTIIAGIVLQVVVLGLFGLLASEYLWRVRKRIMLSSGVVSAEEEETQAAAAALWRDGKFRKFLFAMTGAYACLFIRCVYRIAEMAGGWGNHIMQDQPSFVVLESFMVLIASCLLAAFAPGIFFPHMSHSPKVKEGGSGASGGATKQQTDAAESSSGNDAAEKGVVTE